MKAKLPDNEEERLNALYEYHLLDTPCEKVFDDVTELASSICGTPIAAISLIDKNRQWFKAIKGLDAKETSRDVAFCAHTILGNDMMIVNDATTHPLFKDNPLVTGDPNIRFYAGIPLQTPTGVNLGSLCVIDRRIIDLTPTQVQQLKCLADIVMVLFNSRKILTHNITQIKKHVYEIKSINEQLKIQLTQEKELASIFQTFNKMYSILQASTSLEEALKTINKFREAMFPNEPDLAKLATDDNNPLTIFHSLTSREKQVLRYHIVGYTTKKIAELLGISNKTVARHIENICKRFDCHNKNALTILVFKSGYFIELIANEETKRESDTSIED